MHLMKERVFGDWRCRGPSSAALDLDPILDPANGVVLDDASLRVIAQNVGSEGVSHYPEFCIRLIKKGVIQQNPFLGGVQLGWRSCDSATQDLQVGDYLRLFRLALAMAPPIVVRFRPKARQICPKLMHG